MGPGGRDPQTAMFAITNNSVKKLFTRKKTIEAHPPKPSSGSAPDYKSYIKPSVFSFRISLHERSRAMYVSFPMRFSDITILNRITHDVSTLDIVRAKATENIRIREEFSSFCSFQ